MSGLKKSYVFGDEYSGIQVTNVLSSQQSFDVLTLRKRTCSNTLGNVDRCACLALYDNALSLDPGLHVL